jgi:putative membrane protein insertion efficiency factor
MWLSCRDASCSKPAYPPLKVITAQRSNVDSVSGGTPPLPVRLALGLIRAYKVLISPYFAGSCRFLPTCADYAAEAVGRHGVIRGTWLASKRLARCHPLCTAGHDPVPVELARLPLWRAKQNL